MNTTCACGCCEGIAIATPMPTVNRPGLPAVSCRVGTHATFLETMLARLSAKDFPALAGLKTRDPGDPSIALLDSWAVVADILTFYQERIINEGYLRTAAERRSILELARLVGYHLRPGVAASVYLAFTVDADSSKTPPVPRKTTIPLGSRSQSVPGPGETAQSFETSEDLEARSEWNNLNPRLTEPQVITLSGADPGTDANSRETLYFDGIATNLKTGDTLLIVLGEASAATPPQQYLRSVESVELQADQSRTEVSLLVTSPTPPKTNTVDDNRKAVIAALTPFATDASTLFPGSALASQVAAILQSPPGSQDPPGLLDLIQTGNSSEAIVESIQSTLPKVQQKHDLAANRNFTRLEPWIAQLLTTLNSLIQEIQDAQQSAKAAGAASPGASAAASGQLTSLSTRLVPPPPPSSLGNLGELLGALKTPPSLQPRNSLNLTRSVQQAFSTQSDVAPKILQALNPAAAPLLYAALENQDSPGSAVMVYAFRVKAALFASNFAGAAKSSAARPSTSATSVVAISAPDNTVTSIISTSFIAPTLASAWDGTFLSLDAVYEKILPGSWVALQRNGVKSTKTTFHKVVDVQISSVTATSDHHPDPSQQKKAHAQGFAAKVTRLKLDPEPFHDLKFPTGATEVLRQTVVYAQSELLDLAEEPLDIDIEGETIQLDGVYDGLEAGRWIIVSGERTDILDATGTITVTGIESSELVMVAGVAQGSRIQGGSPWPSDIFPKPPFASVYYVTAADNFGDRLVVGELAAPLPTPTVTQPNPLYQDPVQLAPDFWVNAYVPTKDELNGVFASFAGLLIDPATALPFPGGTIPGDNRNHGNSLWAWRIPTLKAHSILTLANEGLAYSYDINKVTIYGNVVKATNGETRNETLGNGDASQTFQSFPLKQPPLTFVSAPNQSGVDSTLVVRVNTVEWHETDTLAGLGPKDREFITQTDNSGNTSVIFGDGVQGARLPTGIANVKAVYRNGIGQQGNVNAGQISLLQTKPLNVSGVINPLGASGGADADTRDQARANTPLAVLALDRLVSTQDYADFSRTFAGIAKASAARLTDGHRELVHVTIAGVNDIPIDVNSDLYANLVQALLVNGDPYQAIQVDVRNLKLLVIVANVSILPDYLWDPVATGLREALVDAFGFDRRDLGQPVFQSEVISVMQGVTGVAYVDLTTFDSVSRTLTPQQLAGQAGSLGLQPYIEADLAQVNPAPATDQSDRIIPAEIAYLNPDIADTLILNPLNP